MAGWTIRQTVDLANGCGKPAALSEALMVCGDVCAHTWEITVLEGGRPAELTGMNAMCYFNRADCSTVAVQGVVSGNKVRATFTQECYAIEGPLVGLFRMTAAGRTILTLAVQRFFVGRGTNLQIIDPGEAIPNIDELLAQIAAMEAATAAANEAAVAARAVPDVKANALGRVGSGALQVVEADAGSEIRVIAECLPVESGSGEKGLSNPWAIGGTSALSARAYPGGLNLIEQSEVREGWINASGAFQADSIYRCSGLIPVEIGQAYSFQLWSDRRINQWFGAAYYDDDGAFIPGSQREWSRGDADYASAELSAPGNAAYVVMMWVHRSAATKAKLELGACSPWLPALGDAGGGDFTSLSFAPGEELWGAKVDFAAGKWWQTWTCIEISDFSTITGTPGVGLGKGCYFSQNIPDLIKAADYRECIVCSHLPTAEREGLARTPYITGLYDYSGQFSGRNWLYIDDGVSASADELKAALAGKTLRIAYRLAEPIEHEIAPQIHQAAANKTTVILQDGDELTLAYNRAIDAELGELREELTGVLPEKPRDFFLPEVARVASRVLALSDAPCLVLMHETDMHMDWGDADSARRTVDTFTNMRAVAQRVAVHGLVSTGDWLATQNASGNQTDVDETISRLRSHMLAAHDRVFMVNGNHDGILGDPPRTRNYNSTAAHNCEYVVREGDASYYYADFWQVRTRCLFLDTTVRENGPDAAASWGIGDVQLAWIREVLAALPSGWNVMVFSHIPIFDTESFGANRTAVRDLFNAFHQHTGDFASVTGGVIAWISGHEHMDYIAPSEKSGCDFPVFCTTSSGGQRWAPDASYGYVGWEDTPFVDGTVEQDAWDVIVYRPDLSKVYLVRFGAGQDRELEVI